MLRDYQIEGKRRIKEELQKLPEGQRRVLCVAATGAGKTWMFVDLIRDALGKDSRAWVIAPKRQLVKQAAGKLSEVGVPYGVMMANHPLTNYKRNVQVCSRETVRGRIDKYNFAAPDIIIIDEAHLGYDFQKWIVEKYPKAILLGFTATPVLTGSTRALGDIYKGLVEIANIDTLIRQGWLVSPRIFLSDKQIDTSGIKKSGGDFNQRELAKRADKRELIGNIVNEWRKHAEQRPTVAFATNVEHSQHIVEDFNSNGIPAAHIDAKTKDGVRDSLLADLKDGKLKVLSSVGVFTEGFDLPAVGCVVFARPTESLSLYIQMAGRGLRPINGIATPGENCIFLDHAGNTMRHGLVTEVREWSLDKGQPKETVPPTHECPHCEKELNGFPMVCPWCGGVLKEEDEKQCQLRLGDNSELREFDPDELAASILRTRQDYYNELETMGFLQGWKAVKVGAEFKRKFGAYPAWQDRAKSKGMIKWRPLPLNPEKMEPYWEGETARAGAYAGGGR